MKGEKVYILVSVLLMVTGMIFIIKKPLGDGEFTDVKLWSDIIGLWSSNFVFFHIGAAYEKRKKKQGGKKDDTKE